MLQVARHLLEIVVELFVHDERADGAFALLDVRDDGLRVGGDGVGARGELGDVVERLLQLRLTLRVADDVRGAVDVGERLLRVLEERARVVLEIGRDLLDVVDGRESIFGLST